jgi:hypothetical protein
VPIIETEDGAVWLEESLVRPKDKNLWNKAKITARLDRDYSSFTSKLIAKRIYNMLGGTYVAKKLGKDKGKSKSSRQVKAKKPTKSTAKRR